MAGHIRIGEVVMAYREGIRAALLRQPRRPPYLFDSSRSLRRIWLCGYDEFASRTAVR